MRSKKLMVLLLTIAMMVTMMPVTAFAEGEDGSNKDSSIVMDSMPDETGLNYYRAIYQYNGNKTVWFKASVTETSKVRPVVTYMDGAGDIESAQVYYYRMKFEDLTENLNEEDMPYYTTADYFTARGEKTVNIKVVFNDDAEIGDLIWVELIFYGIADTEVEIDCDEYYWQKNQIYCPQVLSINNGKTDLEPGVDYTTKNIEFRNHKSIGIAEMVITGMGDYKGTKTVYYHINPMGTKLKSVSGSKKSMTVKWTAQKTKMPKKHITGYVIEYTTADDPNFDYADSVTVKKYTSTSKTIKKLAKGKYLVRIKTYYSCNGEKLCSKPSAAKTVKVK